MSDLTRPTGGANGWDAAGQAPAPAIPGRVPKGAPVHSNANNGTIHSLRVAPSRSMKAIAGEIEALLDGLEAAGIGRSTMNGGDLDVGGMPEIDEPRGGEDGALREAISNAVVGLYKQHYGKGPTRCRTYVEPELVVVVLGGGYTASERTLFEGGRWHEVREARQQWQDTMRARFVETIERLTGQNVRAFMSANHQDPDLAVELFVLESAKTV
jgi:uncharacterized protein YbcI